MTEAERIEPDWVWIGLDAPGFVALECHLLATLKVKALYADMVADTMMI